MLSIIYELKWGRLSRFKVRDQKQQKIMKVKVRNFQNENIKSSHCPKYEQKKLKNSAPSVQGRIFQTFRSYFGQWDDSIFSF